MTRRAPLPVNSPDWIPYFAALQDATDRLQSKELAIAKLDGAFAARAIQCKLERIDAPPVFESRVAVFHPEGLLDASEDRFEIRINGKPQTGLLFLWKADLNKFFGISAKPAQASTVKKQQTRGAVGHPVVHDWREITLIIVRLHRDFRKLTGNALVGKVLEYLAVRGIKAPADSELHKAVKQVMTFEERHAQQLKQFSETQ